MTLAQSFRSGYTDELPLPDGSLHRVGSYSVWDAQWAWAASEAASVRIGVRNMLDRDPPFTNQGNASQVGYDPGYADPRGRFWYVSATWRFR